MILSRRLAPVLVLFFLALDGTDTKFLSATVKSDKGWNYLTKFCFDDTGEGLFRINLKGIKGEDTRIILYNDLDNSWPAVYNSPDGCKGRQDAALPQNWRRFPIGEWLGFKYEVSKSGRQHFWFVVISNCDDSIEVEYELTFRNGGGKWKKEFSYDEQGLPELYLFFAVMYLIGWLGILYLMNKWRRRRIVHPIQQMLVCSYATEFTAVICGMIHFFIYMSDGVGAVFLERLGKALHMLARLGFIAVLLLVAKGWTITTSKLNKKRHLAVLMLVLLALHIAVLVLEVTRDQATTLYVYESPPGYALLALNMVTLFFFVIHVIRTSAYERSDTKKAFYRKFGFIFSFWFVTPTLLVMIAHYLDPWVRRISVEAVDHVLTFLAYGLLPFMGRPSTRYEVFSGEMQLQRVKIPTLAQLARVKPSAEELNSLETIVADPYADETEVF